MKNYMLFNRLYIQGKVLASGTEVTTKPDRNGEAVYHKGTFIGVLAKSMLQQVAVESVPAIELRQLAVTEFKLVEGQHGAYDIAVKCADGKKSRIGFGCPTEQAAVNAKLCLQHIATQKQWKAA